METKLEGLDGILKNLSRLGDSVQKKHVFGAALAGAAIIRKQAVANAKAIDRPARKGEIDSKIYPAIKYHRAKRAPMGTGMYRVGVEGGASGKTRVPPSYWRLVEFGTEDTAAQPFMRPTMEQCAQAVYKRVGESLWERINNEIAKGGV